MALVSGVVIGSVFPPIIEQMMPESWHLPERHAVQVLQRDGWAAGERLLEVSDQERWVKVQAALRSVEGQDARSAKSANRKASRAGNGAR